MVIMWCTGVHGMESAPVMLEYGDGIGARCESIVDLASVLPGREL